MSKVNQSRNPNAIEVQVSQLVLPLVPEFIQARQKDVQLIRETLESNTALTPLERIGHNMKGNGAAFGFAEISKIGQALEQAAQVGDKAAVSATLEALIDYLDRVEVVEKA